MNPEMTRRGFLAAGPASAAAAAASVAKPALLGGTPVRKERFPTWPVADEREEKILADVIRSGRWYRVSGTMVKKFEQEYARLTGAKFCLATSSGTGALHTSLGALGVGPGDEVILPPYTFVATLNVILICHAMPVFVDVDLETSQIDARKIEAAITGRTAAIIPVHYSGNCADLDAIMEISRRRKVPVIEDACQSHLAEWRGLKAGTYGATGCFSFQATKNLNCGEGGAILTSDEELFDRCYAFHYNGSGRRAMANPLHGTKYLMTEFQAAVLLAQMTRLEEQSKIRDRNGQYLTSLLKEIPGILPMKMYEGCTRHAYHVYKFRFQKEQFAGMPRARFMKALQAEGIPCNSGYTPLNKQRYLKNALASRGYRRIYSEQELNSWMARNECPMNDRLCEESVGLVQSMLLGPRGDIDQIAEAIRKIQAHAKEVAAA